MLVAALAYADTPQGDPTCWIGAINFRTCCLPPPHGNPQCWDATYNYERCCLGHGPVDINAVEDISSIGGCELNIFQDFKARAGMTGVCVCFFLPYAELSFLSDSTSCRRMVPQWNAQFGAFPRVWVHCTTV